MSVIHKTDENSDVEIEEGEEHQYEEESFEGKECAICKDIPESIIYLACDHIICLVCAAKSILSTEDPEEIDFSQIVCQICQEQTVLSKEVQETLYQFLTNNQDEEDDDKEEEEQQSQEDSEEQEQNISQDNKQIEKSIKNYLEEQKEESQKKASQQSIVEQDNESEQNEELVLRKIQQENPAQNDNSFNEEQSIEDQQQSQNQKLESIINQEDTIEKDNEEEKQSYNSSEVYLTFQCQIHPSDNYSYYSTSYKKLFCPQCLIDGNNKEQLRDIKPLKRCFPEILQNVQDMLNEVEVQKNLLLNKKKDFEIRQDNCKSQIFSQYKKFEIAVDEMIQQMGDLKMSFLQEFEKKGQNLIDQVSKEQSHFEDKINFFESIIQNVTNFKQNSETPDEEILNYFFKKQQEIYRQLEIQREQDQQLKYEDKQVFQNFHNKIQSEQTEMHKRYLLDMRNKIDSELEKISGLNQNRQLADNIKLNFITQESNRLITEENVKPNKYALYNSLKKASELPFEVKTKKNDYLTYLRTQKRTSSLEPKLYQFRKQSVGRTKYNFWDSTSKFNKDADINNKYYNKTLNKINIQQKQELDRKFQLFDLKYKRENMFNGINTLNGFSRKTNFLNQKPSSNLNHFQIKKFNYIDRIKNKNTMKSFNTKNTSQISMKQQFQLNQIYLNKLSY